MAATSLPAAPASEEIPSRPFADWLNARIAELEAADVVASPTASLASRLWPAMDPESAVRYLSRYRNCLRSGSRNGVKGDFPTDTFPRGPVEDALREYGEAIQNVPGYEDVPEVALEDDAFCERCHEVVTPIEGLCPWCDTQVVVAFDRERRYCERENRMVFPANDGSCWRCGGKTTRGVPYEPCECGCGTMIHRFDRHGRPVKYVRGHAPRSLEKPSGKVPVEPFARYLEQRLREMDLLQALAREHGIGRNDIVNVLARRDAEVDRDIVRRAVWVAGRGGTGKGLPMRPGAPGFFDLYPDDKRSRTCPGCGKGKAPHAKLCKQCRKAADRREGVRPPTAVTRLSEEVIAEAYRVYDDGATLMEAAEAVRERTPHTNVGSTAQALSRQWKRRGWPMRARTAAA